jgi:PAS domain S-box-containing protein
VEQRLISDPDRLSAVRATGLVDGAGSAVLDSLTAAVARLTGVPVSLVTLVDEVRQFMPGSSGLGGRTDDERSIPMSQSICRHVLGGNEPLIISDTRAHPLTAQTEAVSRVGVGAYVGIPLDDGNGQVLGAFCALDFAPHDWTARDVEVLRELLPAVRAELVRAAVERRYRLAIDASGEALYAITPTNGIVWREGSVGAIYGRPAHELDAVTGAWAQAIHPDDRTRVVADWERVLASQASRWVAEYRFLHPDGRVVLVRDRARISRDESGRPLRIAGAVADVTMERQGELAAAHLAAVVRSSRMPIISTGPDGRILSWNRASEEFFGIRAGEAIGQHVSAFIPAEHHDRETMLREAAARGAPVEDVETERVRADGRRVPVSLTISSVVDEGQRPFALTLMFRDLSATRQLEAELRQAQKLDAMGRLAGGVAHDFNNLLTAMRANAELVRAALPRDDRSREDVDEILRVVDRAAALTRQLLAFSRKQVVQPQPLALNEAVDATASMLRRVMGSDVQLTIEASVANPHVVMDRGQLGQVLLNLAVNARDAMPDGGTLTISTDTRPGGPRAPSAPAAAVFDAPHALLFVRDSGVGMDDAVRERAFEPFFTTKDEGRGTGLGLSTVYGIVTQAKGAIWISSRPGAGTTVAIAVPLVREPVPLEGVERTAPLESSGRGTLLVVEDDPAVLAATSRLLRLGGYQVLEASSPRLALERITDCRLRGYGIDAMVTDLVMPEGGGIALISDARALLPDLPVLVVSGYPGDHRLEETLAGRAHFLEKPFSANELLESVRALVR